MDSGRKRIRIRSRRRMRIQMRSEETTGRKVPGRANRRNKNRTKWKVRSRRI